MRISDWSADVCSSEIWVGRPDMEEQAILGLRPVAVAALRTGRTETAGLLLCLADRNRRPEAVGPAIADSRKGAQRMGDQHIFPAPVETVGRCNAVGRIARAESEAAEADPGTRAQNRPAADPGNGGQ